MERLMGMAAGLESDSDSDSESIVETRLAALESLEFLVSKRHNADDFARMGGLVLIAPLWNDTVTVKVMVGADGELLADADADAEAGALVRASSDLAIASLWVLGSAAKYNPVAAEAALEAGAVPLVLRALEANTEAARRLAMAMEIEASSGGSTTAQVQEHDAYDLIRPARGAAKALYALGALLRGGEPAQEQARGLGGGAVLVRSLAGAGYAMRTFEKHGGAAGAKLGR